MPRSSSRYTGVAFSFGPGPLPPAIKYLIIANTVVFLGQLLLPLPLVPWLGLRPVSVIREYHVWQLATYLFLHGGFFHLIFNMLTLWMFGTELERLWGSRYFLKFYFVTGVGAGLTVLAVSPFSPIPTIGASGAIFGVLMAYALYFPDRPIYMYMLFPVKAKIFVLIIGAVALLSDLSATGGGVSNLAHLGGLGFGYGYLKWSHVHPFAELHYRYLKWKMNRLRKKFDVYSGGRSDDWDRRVH